jgi:hypothetical protein
VPTQSTDMFNAYTNYVNANNTLSFTNPLEFTESTKDYIYKEFLYLSDIGVRILRSGQISLTLTSFESFQPLPPAPAAVAVKPPSGADPAGAPAMMTDEGTGVYGGLRPRRPLYSIDPGRRTHVPSRRTRRTQKFRTTRRRTV